MEVQELFPEARCTSWRRVTCQNNGLCLRLPARPEPLGDVFSYSLLVFERAVCASSTRDSNLLFKSGGSSAAVLGKKWLIFPFVGFGLVV